MDIEKIAKLVRLRLTEEEKKRFEEDLKEVLEAFKVLDELETQEEAAFHPIRLENEFREDEVKPGLSAEEVLKDRKNKEGRFFKGPRI